MTVFMSIEQTGETLFNFIQVRLVSFMERQLLGSVKVFTRAKINHVPLF
jgi:hypothetical protein